VRKVGGGEVAASGVYLRRLQKTADESRRVWLWSPKPSPGGRTVSGMPMIPPIGADVAKCASVKGAQNWNGATETDILPSEDCWTVKLTSFEAFVSPTITEIEPLHFSVRLSPLVDVMTIFWPRRYNGRCFDFSASELASLDFAVVEFWAAYLPSALLWSSETIWSTAFRVSKESHSGLAPQPLRKIRKGKLQKLSIACENAASKSDMPRRG
jgi:hypothetical protein